MEAVTGAVLLRRDLPLPAADLSLPRREIALGGAPEEAGLLWLGFVSPRAEGLRVEAWPMPLPARHRDAAQAGHPVQDAAGSVAITREVRP